MTDKLYKERVDGEVVADNEWLRGFNERAWEHTGGGLLELERSQAYLRKLAEESQAYLRKLAEDSFNLYKPSYLVPSDGVYAIHWWIANMGWLDRVVWRYMPFLSAFKF